MLWKPISSIPGRGRAAPCGDELFERVARETHSFVSANSVVLSRKPLIAHQRLRALGDVLERRVGPDQMYGMRFPSFTSPPPARPVHERATHARVAASSTTTFSSQCWGSVQRVLAAVHGEPDLLARDRLAVAVSSTS